MIRHETVLILDFGSQYTQLIARKLRENAVYCEILPPETTAAQLRRANPKGVILSGGPGSVYEEGAPISDPAILEMGVPVLGVCYGMQLMIRQLGGAVEGGGRREYGQARLTVTGPGASGLFEEAVEPQQVWMSHGDTVTALPDGFTALGSSEGIPYAAVEDPARGLYGLQFHPEVAHSAHGMVILHNFLFRICRCGGDWTISSFVGEAVGSIKATVGEEAHVLCGLSGGVDSSVAAALIHRAVGDRLTCLFVDTGLMRRAEADDVRERFRDRYHLPVRHRAAADRFFEALRGVSDPEAKRRIIGETFVRVFEEEAAGLPAAGAIRFLGQGTTYPDRIESSPVRGPSAVIKTHHNVGGLPERMKLRVLEPLRDLFKDEVRALGAELGLDRALLGRHPFPGPGLAVRIPGEVTPDRVRLLQEADAIFIEEIRREGLYDAIGQAFAVLLPVRSVGVMGDLRTYESVVALRAVETSDYMTADWSRLPHAFLARVSTRIVNEVRGVNRVVYDITSKPPGTIEWE